MFNSNEPTMRMFNKDTGIKRSEFNHPALSILNRFSCELSMWICSSDMTEEEKIKHPEHKTTGGFLRTNNYKETWKLFWDKLSQQERDCIKTLPNFDVVIFEEITGIKI